MIRQLLPWPLTRKRAEKPRAEIIAHASALGFQVGDGPLRISNPNGTLSGDYYVTAVHENRLTLKPRRFGFIRSLISRLRYWWLTR